MEAGIMIAAIYARKTSDDEAEGVARQVDAARAFASQMGWAVAADHVYLDDGISGADSDRLKGRRALLSACVSRPRPFDAVIVRDDSRLSREPMHIGQAVFMEIADAGIDLWFYESRTQFKAGTFEADVIGAMKRASSFKYRQDIATWTTAALEEKWRKGFVVGSKIFGYDHAVAGDAAGKKSPPKVRVINEAEAAVVREIFTRYAEGMGFKRIAHTLNGKHVPTPRAQQGRRNGWDQGTTRAVLTRSIYRGTERWKTTKKRDTRGRQRQRARPEHQWLERPAPRIVSVELAARVDGRLAERRARGTSPDGHKSPAGRRYLLSGGILRCACGGTYVVVKFKGEPYYQCSTHRRKGKAVSARALRLPVTDTDASILGVI
jgi:site-specific DNA recombinase